MFNFWIMETTRYKYCIVPLCTSSTVKNPDKIFIRVPEDKKRRTKWLKACRRGVGDYSTKTTDIHVCEDHFNIADDMDNYLKFKLMGGKKMMKPNVVPHIFNCQPDRKRTFSVPARAAAVKRANRRLVDEAVASCSTTTVPMCSLWKEQLGFTGAHPNANLTPEQCYSRLNVCSIHFTDGSFTTPHKHRLVSNAVPTLFLSRIAKRTIAVKAEGPDAEMTDIRKIQTDTCELLYMQKDAETQTDIGNEIAGSFNIEAEELDVEMKDIKEIQRVNEIKTFGVNIKVEELDVKTEEVDTEQSNIQTTQTEAAASYEQKDSETQTNIVFQRNESCQTSERLLLRSPRELSLRSEIRELKKELSKNKKRLGAGITLDDVVKFFHDNYPTESYNFLKAQLHFLNKAPKGCRYNDEYKQFSLSLYFFDPKSYEKLASICRLPSKSTLERFTQCWTINPGFNDFLFELINLRIRLLQGRARDCILCIDEICLKSSLYYHISNDKIVGFQESFIEKSADIARKALIVRARGIANSWKQPVAYFFYNTSPSSEELKSMLFEAVRKLNAIGLNVLGVVSDQGSNFYKLVVTDLKLTEENPCFLVDTKELVYMFDVPYLLNSTRNNFFKHKFLTDSGVTNKSYLERMYNFDKLKQYRLVPKLTNDHVFPKGFQKKDVKLATQIFSHSVATAMQTYIDFGILPKGAKATAEFIEKINTFFDILNIDNLSNHEAFMSTDKQTIFLQEMDDLFKHLRVETVNGKNITMKLKFIFGWRLTLSAIKVLFKTLQNNGCDRLFTRNLQRDCPRNFFGQIQNSSGNAKNPTPIQFCRAFKKLSLRYFDEIGGTNCKNDINEVLLHVNPKLLEECNKVLLIPRQTYNPLRVLSEEYRNLKWPECNALDRITDYILKQCLIQHTCEICINFSNSVTDTQSTSGGLALPFSNIKEYVCMLEDLFTRKFNELAYGENVGQMLKRYFSAFHFNHPCQSFPLNYFISLYTRVRIYLSLKFANKDLKICRTNKQHLKLSILKHV